MGGPIRMIVKGDRFFVQSLDSLYALEGDGTRVAGWPVPLYSNTTNILAPSAALADLEGDGALYWYLEEQGVPADGKVEEMDSGLRVRRSTAANSIALALARPMWPVPWVNSTG